MPWLLIHSYSSTWKKVYEWDKLGMQVIGKSTKLVVPALESEVSFPVSKNLFDFQITNEKKMNYTWSLYKVDNDEYEERA